MFNQGYPYINPVTGQWVIPGANAPAPQQNIAQTNHQSAQAASQDLLIRVTGMQGAKAYQLPANSRAALFDDTDDVVIIKTTDGAGFPSYRRARLDWLPDEPESDSVTRKEFDDLRNSINELKGLILNGKQSVWKSGKSAAGDDGE